MNSLTRWIASLTMTPLAVLTLQGLAFDVQALTDSNADAKELAANRAGAMLAADRGTRPASVVYVPVSPRQLDRFKPVLPPERALGLAMAQVHSQRTGGTATTQLARADSAASAARR